MSVPAIKPGQRVAVFGRSGSGKSYWTRWLMLRSRMSWIVLDTKHDPGFDAMRLVNGLPNPDRLLRLWGESRIIVARPKPQENSPRFLDAYLGALHESYDGFGVCIDEVYQFALGSKPGPGLTGLVTRGRARKQSVIMGSQRPSWVPRFVYTEANYMAVFQLTISDDRKRIRDMTGRDEVFTTLPPREWFWYDVGLDRLRRFAPVSIVTESNT